MDKLKITFTNATTRINWFWVAAFVVLTVFFWLTPLQVDDYTFYTTFSSIHSLKDFIHIDHYLFNNVNGRVAGNTLALLLVSYRVLSSLFRAAVVVAILLLGCRLLKVKTTMGRNALVASLLFIPVPILAETYAWRAGFFNYVTPVALVLFTLSVIWNRSGLYWERSLIRRIAVYLSLFLAGFLVSLFTENITVGTFAGAILVIIWALFKERSLLPKALSLMIGSSAGTWLMFSSPVYTRISSGGDAYRHVGHSATGILQVILHNTDSIGRYLVVGNTWLYLVIFAGIISGTWITVNSRKLKGWLPVLIVASVALLVFLFAAFPFIPAGDKHMSVTQSLSSVLELIALGLFFLVCLIFSTVYIRDKDLKNKSITLIIYTGLITAPLFLVQPISPRIFYTSYVLLVIYAAILVKIWGGPVLSKGIYGRRLALFLSYIFIISGAIFYLSVFGAIRLREIDNAISARSQISQGHKTVHIKKYPFSNFTYKDKYLTGWPSRYFSGSVCEYRQCDQQHIKVVFD